MTTGFNTMVFLDKNAEVRIDFDFKAKLFWYKNFPYFCSAKCFVLRDNSTFSLCCSCFVLTLVCSVLTRDNVNINDAVPCFPFCKTSTLNRAGQLEHHLKGEMDITIHEATFMLFALADKL